MDTKHMRAEKLQNSPVRGLRAPAAAAYLGMGTSKFLDMVSKGRLARPMRVDGMTIWDRYDLDADIERLKTQVDERPNPIEEHYGITAAE
jgi:predicted DNA-binding transcriptional regulator AlpA